MNAPITITSDTDLDDVDHHFRVTAGPGAGKTRWLATHIRNVIGHSTRLTPCSKVAVISYTNVAVREIINRLGSASDAVEASTIHSFLFRHVVRPYVHLIRDSDGRCLVAHDLADTHDEHFPAYDKVAEWLADCDQRQLLRTARRQTYARLLEQLKSLAVRVDPAHGARLMPRKIEARDNSILSLLTPEALFSYKKRYWGEGTIDHEDVLYFAFQILREHPNLTRFLSDRFPYLFIDEFQDTPPVQASLVQWLAEAGTVVGVIGDPEQAIFGFLDASAEHFRTFALSGSRFYEIAGNHRSSKAIIDLLNRIRPDGLQQSSERDYDGVPPHVYAGNLVDALAHAKQQSTAPMPLLILTRTHVTAAKARLSAGGTTNDPWKGLHDADADRGRFIQHIVTGVDLARRRLFDSAIQRIVQGVSRRDGFRKPLRYDGIVGMTERRAVSLTLLEQLLTRHEALVDGTVSDFYATLLDILPCCLPNLTLPAVRAGAFKTAADACRYRDLHDSLRTPEETRAVRTVHQAKGAEAPFVFVVLEDEQVDHCLAAGPSNEERRITYVAVSRARDNLFLFCPRLDRLHEFASIGMTTQAIGTTVLDGKPRSGRSRKK